MFDGKNLALAEELIETIRFFSQREWTPATSTNYSVRSTNPEQYIITRSGVDKSRFKLNDLILIDPKGKIIAPISGSGLKSSAETEIHTAIYERFPEVNSVLHTHSLLGTVLSLSNQEKGELLISGLELLKALEGNTTHEMTEVLPIVPNSQKIPEILKKMDPHFNANPKIHGFLIAGHGLYTWGKDISTAKRHIEAFEFLFECIHTLRSY